MKLAKYLFLILLANPFMSVALGQQPLGQFESSGDVGPVKHAGSAAYDPTTGKYALAGSGTNMWLGKDEFQFVWKRCQGDFILSARGHFLGEGTNPHRKLGWMVRKDLSPDAPYVDVAVHGDGLTSMQFRRTPGSATEEIKSSLKAADVIQLERRGEKFVMSVARFGEPLITEQLSGVALGDEVYVGLFVCAHNADVVERGEFDNVQISVPAKDDFVPYRDYVGSNLEILNVASGVRSVIYQTPASIQAPNWTPDNKSLIYNSDGRLIRFDLEAKSRTPIDTGTAVANNNDHVLSFDGRQIGISDHSPDHERRSIVYIVPTEGGKPRQVTPSGPSYMHGWSPDGKWLVYTGDRGGNLDVYKMAIEGGEEIRLTTSSGLDDGAEFTPDGRWIYFNSSRSGRMQVWRMRPDGSDQEQITRDDFNNWFPHISPDGKQILFITFQPDVKPEDHPFYKQVYLRLMPITGGEPKVVAYLYGGQGTINVPSWSPDSRSVAFVSNSAGNR